MVESSLATKLYAFEQQEQGCLWTLEQYQQSLENPLTLCLEHHADSQLAAYLLAMHLGDMFEILQLTVAAAYQRQGIATQLLMNACQHAKRLGCERLVLEVRQTNEKAIALYQKLGFVQDAIRKNYYTNAHGVRENALLLSLTC